MIKILAQIPALNFNNEKSWEPYALRFILCWHFVATFTNIIFCKKKVCLDVIGSVPLYELYKLVLLLSD